MLDRHLWYTDHCRTSEKRLKTMEQTKPRVILKKYRSIFLAAVVVEAVSFLVSLTDTIVAGNMVGPDAFMAIGLMAPFFSIATFLTSMVNSGTVLSFSESIGAFQKKRAHEFFSQGVYLAVGIGVLYTLILLLLKKPIIIGFHVSDTVTQYVSEYYDIIVFYFLFEPISCLLDNIVVADGGEKLSAAANVVQIVGNVGLSLILSRTMGVQGIALASVLCNAVFVIMICIWFFIKRSTLKLLWCFHLKDCLKITKRGVIIAATYGLAAITTHLINVTTIYFYDDDFLQIVIVAQKIFELTTLFLGLAMSLQPLIGTLRGENNTKAARALLKRASVDMIISGGVLMLLLMIFAEPVVRLFGVEDEWLIAPGISAVYISSATLIPAALLVFLFIVFFLFHRYKHTLVTCVLKDFVVPAGLILLLTVFWRTPSSVWIGLSASSALTTAIVAIIVFIRNGTKFFPVLITEENDENIFIYSFEINEQNVVGMSETAGQVMKEAGYSPRMQVLLGAYLEDLLLLVKEKNTASKKEILAECTLILEERGVRLILRDLGKIFDITDEEARPDSFRQYLVTNMISALDIKTYLVTTGYNRNEFVFTE